MDSVLIIGCGDIGLRLADLCGDTPVTGLVRSQHSLARLRARQVLPKLLDLDAPFAAADLPTAR